MIGRGKCEMRLMLAMMRPHRAEGMLLLRAPMEHTDERRPSIMTLPPVTVGGWHCKVHFLKPMDYLLSMILVNPSRLVVTELSINIIRLNQGHLSHGNFLVRKMIPIGVPFLTQFLTK